MGELFNLGDIRKEKSEQASERVVKAYSNLLIETANNILFGQKSDSKPNLADPEKLKEAINFLEAGGLEKLVFYKKELTMERLVNSSALDNLVFILQWLDEKNKAEEEQSHVA